MSIHQICTTNVITGTKKTSILEAIKLMKENNVGNIVIVEDDTYEDPIGIVTDRDIALAIENEGFDPEAMTVETIMSGDLLTLEKDEDIFEALKMMSQKRVRRAPVVDENDKLFGIVTFDDFVMLIADELNLLEKLVCKQIE